MQVSVPSYHWYIVVLLRTTTTKQLVTGSFIPQRLCISSSRDLSLFSVYDLRELGVTSRDSYITWVIIWFSLVQTAPTLNAVANVYAGVCVCTSTRMVSISLKRSVLTIYLCNMARISDNELNVGYRRQI